MVFGVGPAGTGKTYLAVAMGIAALMSKRVNRIVLARPRPKPASAWAFCPERCRKKSILIFVRSTTRSTTCWNPTRWTAISKERHRDRAHRFHGVVAL